MVFDGDGDDNFILNNKLWMKKEKRLGGTTATKILLIESVSPKQHSNGCWWW